MGPESTEKTLGPEKAVTREPQDFSKVVPGFQRGSGVFEHTGGTFPHGVVLDYPRYLVWEMHLGKFPDSMEIQCWNFNFKTEVCSETADPYLTMQWIKEVEIAKCIDELMTSRSIVGRTDYPDHDMLDAMIASALKKLFDSHVRFRQNSNVEEQRAQKYD